ncbi:cathepsin L.1 [Trichomycterus rosablanca]|uniref:cathepsin L.1 n=1 Tax=Trichomycterus rosablanca TaxID=2290929 RepID=UPI002F356C44
MKVLIVFVAVVAANSLSLEDLEFNAWKLKFGKIYESIKEETQRKNTWLENRKYVLLHNMQADQGIKSYRLEMNIFADMDNQEFRHVVLDGCLHSFNQTKGHGAATFHRQAVGAAVPSSVDWRAKGYVTEVKDQQQCASSWAFSATGALEGQMFKYTGKLVSLSEQQLVDCSQFFGNKGCKGGWMDAAFLYVIFNFGLDTESSYPYEARDNLCRYNNLTTGATCSGYVDIISGDEEALQEAVASVGPVSAAIDAGHQSFQLYSSGIYYEPACSSSELDHCVLIVGYDSYYWLVKNSWGVDWGEKGYIRMARNRNNQCGIATLASYPLVAQRHTDTQDVTRGRMKTLIVFAAVVVVATAKSLSLEDLEFNAWKLKFGKIYESIKEETQRKNTWLENRKYVLLHNMQADQGIKSYRLEMNIFADMDNQEFRHVVLNGCLHSFNQTKGHGGATFHRQAVGAAVPSSVDWRAKGYVTDVKDQQQCGSCWAFSATGALEGQMFKYTGKLVSLSEQQLVDCSQFFGNYGCNGGWMDAAFLYVIFNFGLDTESSYPYEARDNLCRYNPNTVGTTCSGYVDIDSGDEEALQEAVASIGPVSVAIDAGHQSFQLYSSGIYYEPACSSSQLDHGVLAVGYDSYYGQDYWLVKNSWGVGWGEEGYIRMARNRNNQCGIATSASYPLSKDHLMRVFILIAAVVALGSAASISLEDLEFHSWKLKFGKSYSSIKEESQRKITWIANRKYVLVHNMLADQGIKNYRLGMTFFADMDNQEYRQAVSMGCLGAFNRTKGHSGVTFLRQAGGAVLPNTVDWRDKGYVTDIKDQKDCGSCWAFSATGSLEGQNFRKTGKLVSLSEQQLVDCSTSYGNMGCGGGLMDYAFKYIKDNKGIDTEESYPYEATDGDCRFNTATVGATCTGYVDITSEDENALQEAVATIGPISVAIDAGHESFQLYESGIYDEPDCSSTELDHGVLAVGYGTDNGKDYWLVKNSWGLDWGTKGYIKMSMKKNNQCGIATAASYPLV